MLAAIMRHRGPAFSPARAQAVFRWVAYREGQVDTAKLCWMLKPLPVQQTIPHQLGAFGMIVPISNGEAGSGS
jgi:hypothetical protein